VLAGLGLTLSTAASLFSYRALHEPLEAVGASVVSHLASSKCTAIALTLAGLSVARSDVISGETEDERTATDASTVLGVVTPGSWQLEDYHASATSEAATRRTLQQLPADAFTALAQARTQPKADLQGLLNTHACKPLGYGLNPEAVRVFRISDPNAGQGHQHHQHGEAQGDWLAFLHGPFRSDGEQKTAFALVNLRAATMEISGHQHDISHFFPSGDGRLQLSVHVTPASALTNRKRKLQTLPSLSAEDAKLMALRVVPFANQVVSTEFGIDHHELDRVSRRMAAFILLIGLLATSAVVLISRRSEVKLRNLNRSLLQESRTDGLTRVANRRAWDEALTMEEGRRQRYGHRYGLVVVDLDGFKQINDRQGHPQGDAVLQQTAQLLQEQLRSTDLVARVGGDEFVALVFNPDASGLEELVQRVLQSLRGAGINASIGSALSEERTTLDQTWAKADAAMYAVKATARA
jgi:diguanylate cyclase (GGDEF)-like protein